MVKFVAIASSRARGVWKRCKPCGRRLRKVLILVALAFILAGSGTSLAQMSRREQPPPRPQQKTDPWPWFLAFILLGVAWYPAFKNSKRELER